MGYGVMLWSMPEYDLHDGDIVPIYVKSNISHQYIIALPQTGEKVDVPLWQVTDPVAERKIQDVAAPYTEFQHMYARVVLDGLPIRAQAENTAKQVYRLRKDEVIKVLYKGRAGEITGNTTLKGEWLRVLASDGTIGWCFSYNLRLFNEMDENQGREIIVEQVDEALEKMLATKWYPEEYKTLMERNTIDLSVIKNKIAFDPGAESGTIHFENEDLNLTYPYSGVTKTTANVYKFNETPLAVTIRSSSYIVLQYMNEKGMPTSYNLVTLPKDVSTVIAEEKERRAGLFDSLVSLSKSGYSSSYYGKLQFYGDNQFTWADYDLLSPSIIPAKAGQKGTVVFDKFLTNSLAFTYDGAITFKFDGLSDGITFLYTIEDTGLRLEDATKVTYRDSVITSRGSDSMVMFFSFVSE